MTTKKQDSKPRVHVISRERGWAVKKEGFSRASTIHSKKEVAVGNARKLKGQGHDIIVHRKDGSIERWEKAKKRS